MKIRTLKDIVDWRLCIGCGACTYQLGKEQAFLKDVVEEGIRPVFRTDKGLDDLSYCPSYQIVTKPYSRNDQDHPELIGPNSGIWEGYSNDTEVRHSASSGGILSALAHYCLEEEEMDLVVHTAMDPDRPWKNKSVVSRTREDLLYAAGSRYLTSSPCELLDEMKNTEGRGVFIGKPCDVAAVQALRKTDSVLDSKLRLVLTFFCAGTPSTQATIDQLMSLGIEKEALISLKYRGNGWPGGFDAQTRNPHDHGFLPYMDAWSILQASRPFRCKLCPDGLGELADVSCGDAWHRYSEDEKNEGLSLIIARNSRGREIVERAAKAGYITIDSSSAENVLKAQGLPDRRKEIWGRQFALHLFGIPTSSFQNFALEKSWKSMSFMRRLKVVLGTIRRIISRGLYKKTKIPPDPMPLQH